MFLFTQKNWGVSHKFLFFFCNLPFPLFCLVRVEKSHVPSPWHCGTTRCHAASTVLAPYNTRAAESTHGTQLQAAKPRDRPARGAKLNPTKCRRSSPPPPYRRCRYRRWPRRPGPASGSRLPPPPPRRTGPAPLPEAPARPGSRPSFPRRWSASATAPPSASPSESSASPSRRANFSRFCCAVVRSMRNVCEPWTYPIFIFRPVSRRARYRAAAWGRSSCNKTVIRSCCCMASTGEFHSTAKFHGSTRKVWFQCCSSSLSWSMSQNRKAVPVLLCDYLVWTILKYWLQFCSRVEIHLPVARGGRIGGLGCGHPWLGLLWFRYAPSCTPCDLVWLLYLAVWLVYLVRL